MTMERTGSVEAVRRHVATWRKEGCAIGFVPTMGALHAGHLALVEVVKARGARAVVSIFVNPKQFGPHEDFDRYPRDVEGDAAKLSGAGADLLFAPAVDEVYPPGVTVTPVHVSVVSEGMEGARRPGHFDGVATVVKRLFDIVEPDFAVFGQKDGQQVAVVRKMVADLRLPVEIVVRETIREPDGLALSSRNQYLSPDERRMAPALFRALLAGHLVYQLGEKKAEKILKMVRMALETEPGIRLDALDLVDAVTMQPVKKVDRPVMLAGAIVVGKTRLIDNVRFGG